MTLQFVSLVVLPDPELFDADHPFICMILTGSKIFFIAKIIGI